MTLVDQLRRSRRLYGTCPHCQSEFRMRDARLFSVTEPLSQSVLQKVQDLRAAIRERRRGLRVLRDRATTIAQRTAHAVNLGKILEKIAPSFPGFAFDPRDCRALFEPIDYLVFQGLGKTERVDAIYFVDVKSGRARLTPREQNISDVVDRKGVTLIVVEE